ncbi:MAG: hypothetical protein Q8N95_07295 [Desulfobacterales bacterium]|nr:hypothetical protein [Desulfobacterales bacterium]
MSGILWRNWGLTLKRVETHNFMGVLAVPHSALIEFYYRKHDRDKVLRYFKEMEAAEDDFDIEFYGSELTNDQIEQLLGPLVKRNKVDNLVSS